MKEVCSDLSDSKLNCCFIVRVYEYGFFLLRLVCETSNHPSVHFCSRLDRSLNQEEQLDLLLLALEESENEIDLDASNNHHNKRATKIEKIENKPLTLRVLIQDLDIDTRKPHGP